MTNAGLTRDLVREVLAAGFADLPADARDAVRNAILDDIGIAFLGYATAGAPVVAYARETGGGVHESTLIGDGNRVSCLVAAGAHAQLANDTNFNEAGPGHHILSALAQTALAVGERVGASGADVISTVGLVYDINGRLHTALTPESLSAGYGIRHIPMMVALTAGKLLGLGECELNRAVSLAWFLMPSPTVGPAFWHEPWKRRGMFHLGTCTVGIQAALLAQKGFDPPVDVLDHEELYAGVGRSSPEPFYYPRRMMQLKLWQTSRGLNPGIQALLELVAEHRIVPEEIAHVVFRSTRLYLQHPFNNPAPTDFWEGAASVQWAAAMALLGYESGSEWYVPERFIDERCRALARKVVVEEDLAAAAGTVETVVSGARQAISDSTNEVELTLVDGRRLVRRKAKTQTLGHPLTPLSDEQLARKFTTCVSPVLGEAQTEELLGQLVALAAADDVRRITRLYAPATVRE